MKNKRTGDWAKVANTRMLTRIINILYFTEKANKTMIIKEFLGRRQSHPINDALLFLTGIGIIEARYGKNSRDRTIKYYSLTDNFREFMKKRSENRNALLLVGRKNAI